MMKKSLASLALLGLLAACASTPKEAPVEAKPVEAAPAPVVAPVKPAEPAKLDPLKDPNNLLSKRGIYFDYDKYDIRADQQGLVEAHGRFLAANPNRSVRVEGNADDRGSREYNLALGQKRAEAVRKAVAVVGAKESQVEATSNGEEKPRATGADEASWAENRRADVVYDGGVIASEPALHYATPRARHGALSFGTAAMMSNPLKSNRIEVEPPCSVWLWWPPWCCPPTPVCLTMTRLASRSVSCALNPKRALAALEQRVGELDTRNAQKLLEVVGQISELSQQIAQLRGELEVIGFNLQGLQKRQQDLYVDLDGRMRALERGRKGQTATPSAEVPESAAGGRCRRCLRSRLQPVPRRQTQAGRGSAGSGGWQVPDHGGGAERACSGWAWRRHRLVTARRRSKAGASWWMAMPNTRSHPTPCAPLRVCSWKRATRRGRSRR